MARIRSIQPSFARSPSMRQISREARLLFVLLWTAVDDEGRCFADPDDLAQGLYPDDVDAPQLMELWLSELEREGCIERYEVDETEYLRVVHWHRHQRIYHPTQSLLPAPPHERLSGSAIRENPGRLRGRGPNRPADQALAEGSSAISEFGAELDDDESPVVVTQQSMLRDLRRIRRRAESDGLFAAALRAAELMGKFGLASNGRREPAEPLSPSPGQLLPRE